MTSASRATSPPSLSRASAATSAADSGAVQMPSVRATRRCASWIAVSSTATAPPPVSRRSRNIWRPAKGEGTRSPAACVVGLSQAVVVSAPEANAFTTGAQPSAWTAKKRGSGPESQPIARSSS